MSNTTRQYNVSIFPCPETGDAPSAAIYMEVADGFEEFYREITERKAWGQGYKASEAKLPGEYKLRICDGTGEDFYSFCEDRGASLPGCCIAASGKGSRSGSSIIRETATRIFQTRLFWMPSVSS